MKKSDGSLDRRALGELLFKNPNLLAKQESLVYPAFERRIQEMIDANKKAGGFAINATLLYKTPALLRQCKKIIYVDAPLLVRVWRSRRRDKMPLLQILRRMKAQKGLEGQYKKFAAENNIEFIRVNNFLCDEGIKKWIF